MPCSPISPSSRFGSLAAGVDELNLLAAPDSPLRDLMQGVDSQTQLTHTNAGDKATTGAEAKLARVGSKASGFASLAARAGMNEQENQLASVLGEAFGSDAATGKPIDPASRVDAHFKWVHEFVTGKDGEPAPMETAITKMGAMYQSMNAVAATSNPGAALLSAVGGGGGAGGAGGGSAAAQLATIAKDLPKPVAAMLQTVSQSGSAVTSSGASAQLSDTWKSKVLPLCQEAFNRYPFVAGSSDVPLDRFHQAAWPVRTD